MKPKKTKSRKIEKPHPMPVDALVYPRFSGVPTFMRLPHIPRAEELDLALIGIPFDGGTTYRPGARFGPRNVRVQSAMIRPWNPVLKTNPFEKWRIGDFGDLSINPLSIEDTYQRITEQLGDVLVPARARSVWAEIISSSCLSFGQFIAHFGPVGFLQLDAHGDTWGGYFGSPHSHGTPVKYAIEEGLIEKGYALQVGLRGQVYSDTDFDFARKNGIKIVLRKSFIAAESNWSTAIWRSCAAGRSTSRWTSTSSILPFAGYWHAAGGRPFQRADSGPGTHAQRP